MYSWKDIWVIKSYLLLQGSDDSESISARVTALESAGSGGLTDTQATQLATLYNQYVLYEGAMVLLWTNSSPTSAFAAQTITISGGFSSYRYLVIECYYSTGAVYISDNLDLTGYSLRETSFGNPFYALSGSTYRSCTINKSAGTVVFQQGISGGTNNAYCIPGKIFGL